MKFFVYLLLLFSSVGHAAVGDNSKVQSQTTVTATVTSTLGVAENKYRRYLILQNVGSYTVYVKFGSAHSGTEGVWLVPGGVYEPIKPPIGAIYFKSASSTSDVNVIDAN